MHIRPINDGDVSGVVALWDRCGLLRPWNDPQADIRFARETKDSEIFLGEDGKTLVATVMCGQDGHRGWLYYLAVEPDRQGEQFGRAMVRHAEDRLRALGVPKVELMIRKTNTEVMRFYDALGYETEPVITMSRWLRQAPAHD
jgi:ribosomal protein S18 acetylase RimI-like enzyme